MELSLSQTVGLNLKVARQAKGITQETAAATIQMTQPHYSRFERGIFQLNYEQIVILCKLLDITPNDLFNFH